MAKLENHVINYDSLWQYLPEEDFSGFCSFSDVENSQGQSCLQFQYTVTSLQNVLEMLLIMTRDF